jgi:hypothetical protein
MEQVIFGGVYDQLNSAGTTEYNGLYGGSSWQLADLGRRQVISTGGKLKRLFIELDGSPGASRTWTFTLMLNGAATALTCSITGSDLATSDVTNEITVSADDYVSLRVVSTGSGPERYARWSIVFEGDNANESLLLYSSTTFLPTTAPGTIYGVVAGMVSLRGTESERTEVIPTPGKLKNFYVHLIELGPGSGKSWTFTLRKNGVSTALEVAVADEDTSGSDLVNEISVSADDTVDVMVVLSADTGRSVRATWGFTFEADIDGESLVLYGTETTLDPTATEYQQICAGGVGWSAIELERIQHGQSCLLKKFHVLLDTAPGAGKSYALTVRNNQASTNMTVTISDANKTGNDTTNTARLRNGDDVNMMSVPTGTPAASIAHWGIVAVYLPGKARSQAQIIG